MGVLKDTASRVMGGYGWRGKASASPARPSAAALAAQMLAEEFGEEAVETVAGPSAWSLTMLKALQGKPIYQGTVPAHVTKRRRAKNKVARKTRRLNRLRAR